jgi:hypothetical protein
MEGQLSSRIFWRQANSNFFDMCILEWCKLFLKREKHSWHHVVSDVGAFEQMLLFDVKLTPEEFKSYLTEVSKLRDKMVAHLDSLNEFHAPKFDTMLKSAFFLHSWLVEKEPEFNSFTGLIVDPVGLQNSYDDCLRAATAIYGSSIRSEP